MSYFDDYIADGLCCQVCGAYIDDDEPGYPRTCEDCLQEEQRRNQKKGIRFRAFPNSSLPSILVSLLSSVRR